MWEDIYQYLENLYNCDIRYDLYVNIGSDATTDGSSMLVPAGTGYTEMGVSFSGTISVIRANQANGRIIGAIWGR